MSESEWDNVEVLLLPEWGQVDGEMLEITIEQVTFN